ncbi:Stk1 family PASTA domain-containing Ser/Thr kinase [Okibacterium fritillariae]|uniref:non-specific serine/threonine protein kinase n=1 Tax=Okibacterium fritillariae TaxID=123320 RepID=A0A1T5JP27_9MICO|nr:Stk1 family PASTA domain-containing Ser/Thr kinase [Okibacterium fritillariae]SKC52998.1 serine/threonine protein kinase [Okibacterium fritillariae]
MTTSQQTDPMIGRLIDDRYEVRSRIARGGMATVYLATDLRLERRVAIKIMHGHLSDDSNFTSRFVQEARSAARLANPHVVSVFDQGQDSDMTYLVMEHLPGITVRELLRDHGRLTPRQVVDIMDAVVTGLAAAHRAGIVHRDLKPENVLLADDGRIKIGDFGLARAASANTATGQALLGTIAYLSPELVTRGIADKRSDIYALGIMMYEMLTGEQPYKGEQPMQIAYQHANESVPRPSALVPGIPDEFDDLVLWTTERNPDERPADASELLERLREVENTLGMPATNTSHATMLMPAPLESQSPAELTRVLTSQAVATGPVDADDAPTVLGRQSNARRRRGYWLLALILLLTAGSVGTGLYFGAGPGAQVAIPTVVGSSVEDADAALEELELVPAHAQVYSLEVAPGMVMDAKPGAGASVARGTTVTLTVSQGPQPVTLGVLAGRPLPEVQAEFDQNKLTVGAVTKNFVADIPADTIISASRQSDGGDMSQGGDTAQGQTIDLVVSAGPIPDVAGQTLENATTTLATVNLGVGEKKQSQFSDSVPAGDVIGIVPPAADQTITEGSQITLIISKGPDVVTVPDLAGKNIADAKAALEQLGFTVKVTTIVPENAWNLPGLTVTGSDPAAGTAIKRGATVTITANI